MAFWWPRNEETPDNLKQDWIIDGFKECLDGFFIIQNSRFFISDRLITLLGYETGDENLLSEDWWESIIHPDDQSKLFQYIETRRTRKNYLKNQIECRVKHQAGHYVSLLITSHIHPQANGLNSLMGTVININSYRVLQDQLERTIQEAEKTSQTKSKFIASLNHELRTPLNGIRGMANLLQETQLDEFQKAYVNTILSSTQMLLTLVNDILDVSKIASGKLELEKVEFSFHDVISDIRNILYPLAAAKDVDLQCEIASDVPEYLIGDQVRLQQILVNLINNAIKFTDSGSINLTAKLYGATADKISLLFRVVDTGIGIPAEIIPSLFQDFTQASPSTVRTHGGTGLGLSICRKLVTLMGGDIGVQSSVGKGSTFWFTVVFPVVKQSTSDHSSSTNNTQIPELTILVAEDNYINQQVIHGILTNLKQKVVIANNGLEAIKLFDENNFDMIIMDINMPQMDGFEAKDALRATEKGKKLPIIAFTADTITTSAEEFKDSGFDDIVSKPINKSKLIEIIRKYCPLQSNTSSLNNAEAGVASNIDFNGLDQGFIYSLVNEIGTKSMSKLLSIYKTEAEDLIKKLEQENNLEKANKLAHTLAGISENLGIQEIAKIARAIMLIIKNDQERPIDLISQLREKFSHSLKDIDSIIDKL